MNVANRNLRNTSTNISPISAKATDSHKKGFLMRTLMAAALAEAMLIGSAFAAPVPATYDIVASEDEKDDDNTSTRSNLSLPTMDIGKSRSIGAMDIPAPWMAIEGQQNDNLASLHYGDPSTQTALAMGSAASAMGGDTAAIGIRASAASTHAVAIGSTALIGAESDFAVAVGSNVGSTGAQAVALGANTQANRAYAVAVGNNGTMALGEGAIAMGSGAKVYGNATDSIAMGTNALVSPNVTEAMAMGSNTTVAAGAYGSVALGSGSMANRANVLSIGTAGAERQIVNVAAGTQLTDAVNVSQLKGVTDALGAGADIDTDGSVKQPSFQVGGNRYSTVEQAIQAAASSGATDSMAVRYDMFADGSPNFGSVTLGGTASAPVVLTNVKNGTNPFDAVNYSQLSDLQNQVTNIDNRVVTIENGSGTGGGNGGGNGGQWNKDAQGDKIVNVGDGAVAPGSKDAVNGSQLANTAQSTADALGGGSTVNTDGSISMPSYNVGGQQVKGVEGAVNQLDRRMNGMQNQIDGLQGQLNKTTRGAYSGIAGVTALTMIPGVDVGKTVSIGAGVGNYKGYTAAALGGEARINSNWKVRAGVSLSSDGNTVGVGASYQW